ncbi:hypothetical protein SAMN04487988_107215 [Algoriphagus hitonicola]|uniref:Uncharacterized protein n=1 Tax=Algoriphagus hitonicola TaxID=435880 RepID=A0A1I2ULL8_9BACT|nr:hypothetical protein SAMN04487988_107215 [Algoriphagus hitonicola]
MNYQLLQAMNNYCHEKYFKLIIILSTHKGNIRERFLQSEELLQLINSSMPKHLQSDWELIFRNLQSKPAFISDSGKINYSSLENTIRSKKHLSLSMVASDLVSFYFDNLLNSNRND